MICSVMSHRNTTLHYQLVP